MLAFFGWVRSGVLRRGLVPQKGDCEGIAVALAQSNARTVAAGAVSSRVAAEVGEIGVLACFDLD